MGILLVEGRRAKSDRHSVVVSGCILCFFERKQLYFWYQNTNTQASLAGITSHMML